MPGEIVHLVRIPASVVITETQFKALEALACAEKMTLDEEISSLVSWTMYSALQACGDMDPGIKHTMLDMLKRHGED